MKIIQLLTWDGRPAALCDDGTIWFKDGEDWKLGHSPKKEYCGELTIPAWENWAVKNKPELAKELFFARCKVNEIECELQALHYHEKEMCCCDSEEQE
jgi:hypothetical protein